jgi:AcrR family transcriptional regulator
MFAIELELNEKLFLRNPQRSTLGRKILQHSILLIDETGFDRFNFKKLAERIGSAEASIYRYFENKHRLLLYLVNWYWEWIKFRIDYKTVNLKNPREKLRKAISAIVNTAKRDTHVEYIDEDVLHRIVATEGLKAYHEKDVDAHNREGFFLSYKSLCEKLANIILEVEPGFPYPRALASTILEMVNNHIYFAQHLPRLTDVRADKVDLLAQVEEMLAFLVFRTLNEEEPAEPPASRSALKNGETKAGARQSDVAK